MHVAIQGQLGSFHHQVAKQWFGDTVQILPAETFTEVFDILDRHETTLAIVAVENSIYGTINEVYDLLESHSYPIVGEVSLQIEQQLIALPQAKATDITRIYSHPVALAQCEKYLAAHFPDAELISYHDTAGSVDLIKQSGDTSIAAIAGRVAAETYNLPILHENIEDNKANVTRFLILNAKAQPVVGSNKASLIIEMSHTTGALARIFNAFADANANVTMVQSRPFVGKVWEYRFYVDIETTQKKLAALIENIQKDKTAVKVLGAYKAGHRAN